MLFPLLLILACGPSPQEKAAAARGGFRAGLPSDLARTCFDAACGQRDDLQACFESLCPRKEESWSLVPEKVGWDAKTYDFAVMTHVSYTPAGYGDQVELRKEEVYVGVTLVTEQGEEIDLAVQTRFPTDLEESFFLVTNVGKPVRDLIIGLWDRKITPCDSTRSGCVAFGFVLDGPLASWPPGFYDDPTQRQRLPPAEVTLQPVYAGATAEEARRQVDGARQALTRLLEPFGSQVRVAPWRVAPTAQPTAVRPQDPHDRPLVRMLAGSLSVPAAEPVEQGSAVEIVLGGEAARLACVQQARTPDVLAALGDRCAR